MTETSEKDNAERQTEAQGEAGHVSVVYFHGMGSQRRYEETSRLIDRFDSFLDVAGKRGEREGILREINVRAEEGDGQGKPDVTYIKAEHCRDPEGDKGDVDDVRFYEAYWADLMDENRSVTAVIKWIVRQVWRPIPMIWTPWRERQRLRRASLVEILEHPEDWPEGTREEDFEELLRLYEEFDHPTWFRDAEALRAKGETVTDKIAGFLRMIAFRHDGDADRIERLSALATRWHGHYRRREVSNFLIMASILMGILLTVGIVALAVLALLVRVPLVLDWLGLAQRVTIPDWAQATPQNALALGFGILLAAGLRSFLVTRMADVEAWSTYAETDEKFRKREAVLKRSVDLLSHVVNQPDCKRVVVVAHSLGTSVAYDTLLSAVHANRPVNQQELTVGRVDLDKISHFVTLASPVDKISYFFESFRSPIRRYRKVYDEWRGDIGTAPFTKSGGAVNIHWVNIWDRADIIAGPLHSPAAARGIDARVDNVHVNSLTYLNPGAAHGAYFDNYRVIKWLFEIVFDNRGAYEFEQLGIRINEAGEKDGTDYRKVDFGPGTGRGTWGFPMVVALLVPWAWLAYIGLHFAGCAAAASYALWGAIALSAVPLGAVGLRLLRGGALADPIKA